MDNSEINKRVFTNWLKEWKNILPQISNSIKLLGLIVLALSTLITFVFISTPSKDRNFAIYLYVLFGLLLVVIVGIFIDRQSERKAKKSNEKTFVLNEKNELEIQKNPIEVEKISSPNFFDSGCGFKVYHPEKSEWKKPERLTYKELLIKVGLAKNNEEANQMLEIARLSNPFSNLFMSSTNIMFQFGNDIEIEFINESTTQSIEDYLNKAKKYLKETEGKELSEEEIQSQRKELFNGDGSTSKIIFPINLNICVLQKKGAENSVKKLNLPNLLMATVGVTGESIEHLSASENSIICITRIKMLNVKVNGTAENFTIYRTYKFISSKEQIFILQIQWSPESDSAIEVWNELKKMQDSFTIME